MNTKNNKKEEKKYKQIYSGIGGQAVIEGIMMKNGTDYAVGVRKPDGTIAVEKSKYISMTDRYPFPEDSLHPRDFFFCRFDDSWDARLES